MAREIQNCWEYMKCGRQPEGDKVAELGICPAASDTSYDGIYSGNCGGRICWAVAGTFCGGRAQGSFADKRGTCLNCDFYQMVQQEEGMANRHTKFLQFIAQKDRSPFFEKMTYRHVKAGERFVVQDEVENTAYIIKRGSCLAIVEKDGGLHPVDHYGEGDIVGGLGILTGEPRRAHVEAETDMDLWVLSKAQFDEVTEKDPTLLNFITELVADRLDSRRPTAYRTIGKYVATDIIGRGAFSIVYKGEHKDLGMPVVIKMMRHDMALYPEFMKSFRYEAKTIASLNHDHIVKVYDFDERYRTFFIIMEYVQGDSLKDMIGHLRMLPPKLVVKFLDQICSALKYAHQRGIIHRDINPSNIIIKPNDELKILDFGLACSTGTEDFANTGTGYYMSPEQIEGDPVDPRTDIYALGLTAYEMLTGQRPFPEDDLKSLLDQHLSHNIPDPAQVVPDLPPLLSDFIIKAGRRKPDERYQSVAEAMDDLQPLVIEFEVTHNNLSTEKRKMASLILIYKDEHQKVLSELVDDFSVKVQTLGIDIKAADFKDI
jgi:tRNA A-37 threonylcarbamoyl transferase component Bud32